MNISHASKTRLYKYQAAAEDFYVDSHGNIKFINDYIVKILRKYKEGSVEHLAGYMWWSTIGEIGTMFGDFATEHHAAVLCNRQRSYYATIRFCMEAVSDLEYLCKNPQELPNFMTDGDEIKREIDRLKKTCRSERELDAEINKLLLKGKINSQITRRIADALPGCLRDYSMLCLYSHPSMEGFRLQCDQEGTFDLMFQNITYLVFRILVCFYRILFLLKLLDSKTDELFGSIVHMMLDCHRRVVNVRSNYSKRSYRQTEIATIFETVMTWVHESRFEDDMVLEMV